ncbi:MAG TPA: Na(+)/H(+) antiporter subunit D [Candidatus Binatia bacterium]|nr:Na(+)/H(+) antiporter subunit D [Candidatus Binatia bacterium]
MSSLPPAIILISGALVLPLLPRRARSLAFLFFPLLAWAVVGTLEEGSSLTLRFLTFELVPLRVDRLSRAFGYVFVVIAFLGGVYGYHLEDTGQQMAALVYAGSSLGVVFAGDFFTLFVYWEIMAVASAYLIFARRADRSRAAGFRYLIVHLFGGNVLLAGILWQYVETGSILFNGPAGGPGAYLILLSFAINAAIPPLHAWLVDSYPEGTVTGSVFLSAFTTKTAVYVLARGFAGWEILTVTGAIMALYGVIFAFMENDIRRVLAYHIVSQVGYMVAGVGLGTEVAINGSTAHAFAHILYKGLLFMGAGAVLYSTGKSKMSELGGLAQSLPWVLSLYMAGALSISAFPLFSGFVSKSLVVHSAELDHRVVMVLLLNLASVGTFLSIALKVPYFTWFGPDRSIETRPVPWNMYAGMMLAAGINIAIGIYPHLLYRVMPFPVAYKPYTAAHLLETLQLLAFTGFAFWLVIDTIHVERKITLDLDWFYRKPAPAIFQLTVVSLDRLFAVTELAALNFAHRLSQACANPAEFAARWISRSTDGSDERRGDRVFYDPNRHRPPIGFIVWVVLCCFVVLLAWSLFVI